MTAYADLEIGLHRHDANSYRVEPRLRLPDSDAAIRPPNRELMLAQFDLDQLGEVADDSATYGQLLTESLFASEAIRTLFAQARAALSQHQDARLRLRLYVGPSARKLHYLRWETLCDPYQCDAPLSTDENVLFSRYLSSSDWRPVRTRPEPDLKALVVIANPAGLGRYHGGGDKPLAPVDVPGELARAKAGLHPLPVTALCAGGDGKPTLNGILAHLRDGYDILYLVCHGALVKEVPKVWLEDPKGQTDVVGAGGPNGLVTRLSQLPQLPRLIVLASCQSAGEGGEWISRDDGALAALGPRLAEIGVPAVLAMQGNVTMQTVAEFMTVFFEELRRGGQIDRAVAVARGGVRERQDWWMPVLFMRWESGQLLVPLTGDAAPVIEMKHFEPETVYIPSGPFLMGGQEGKGVPAYETPQHGVDLLAYWIGKYPVTNEQYAEFVRQTGRMVAPESGWDGQTPPDDKLKHPITGVTWYDALAYCEWLTEQTGRRYSLPSEAQWEKAARGTDGRIYPWGDEWDPNHCNHGSNQTVPVDAYPAQTVHGCYDMVGNVREWTSTLWGDKLRQPDPKFHYPWANDHREDLTASSYILRVHRGGAAADRIEKLRCSARGAYFPDKPGPPRKRHGFRVVLKV